MSDQEVQGSGPSAGAKIKSAAYIAKCVIVGGLFLVGGIVALGNGAPVYAGLIAIVYATWVLSGIATGGWRLFIY
ncbi:MAG: hypothetical protein LBG11_09290 [Bifidobacteriaceae bacterium]|jgi:hypothetical protein|nr:hypothetical protein [Bifidobacteriaceae bacterium]